MMRLSLVVTVASVIGLAACNSAPKAPVQADQAAPDQAQSADADQPQAHPRKKYYNTGSRLPSDAPDPSVGTGPAGGLSNTTTNASGGGPH